MTIFIISFVVMGLSLLGMAVGVLMKRGSIKGSCGGLNNLPGVETSECPVCGRSEPCENNSQEK